MFCNEKVTCNKQPLPLPHAMLLLDFHTQPHKSFHRYFTHFPTTKCRQPFLLCHAIGKKRLSTFSNLQHFHATTVISCNKRLYIAICCNSIFSFLFWNFIHFLLSAVLFLATPRIAACNALFFCTQHWHRLFSSAYRHNRSVDAKSMHFRLIYVLFCRLTAAGCTVLATRCGQTTQAKYNKWQRCGAARQRQWQLCKIAVVICFLPLPHSCTTKCFQRHCWCCCLHRCFCCVNIASRRCAPRSTACPAMEIRRLQFA